MNNLTHYYDGRLALIDAHGPDHGLYVGYDHSDRTVTIKEWFELSEANPDSGKQEGGITQTTVDLAELLHPENPHYDTANLNRSQGIRETIIDLATAYLAYYGGESKLFDLDDESSCNHFALYWGPSNPQGVDVLGDPIGCEVCRNTMSDV